MKTNWNEITINEYRELYELTQNLTEDELEVAVIALLCGKPEEEIWNTDIMEVRALASKLGFLNEFDFDTKRCPKSLTVAGEKYDVNLDLRKFTYAQYVDLQNYWKDISKNMGLILTLFVIPKGRKYGEGYDLQEQARLFEDNIPITTWNTLCFFFLKKSADLMKGMQLSLAWMVKRMEKRNPKDGRIAEIQKEMSKIQRLFGSLF